MGPDPSFDRVDEGRPDGFARIRARYLLAAMVVHVGEYMAMLVTSYLVYHETRSVVATGLILLCFNVPSLCLAGVATSLTRRFGAARVDACVNVYEGVIALVPMTLAATNHLSVAALLAWVLGYGIGEGLNAPNSLLVRQLIAEPGRLPELNSAYTRNVAAAAVGGLLLGGGIFVLAGPAWVFLITAVTAIPEVLVFIATSRRQPGPDHVQSASESFSDALRLLRTEPGLWAACRFAVLCFFVGQLHRHAARHRGHHRLERRDPLAARNRLAGRGHPRRRGRSPDPRAPFLGTGPAAVLLRRRRGPRGHGGRRVLRGPALARGRGGRGHRDDPDRLRGPDERVHRDLGDPAGHAA